MSTHEELARFLRQFDKLPAAVRAAFIDAVLALAGDLGVLTERKQGAQPPSVVESRS